MPARVLELRVPSRKQQALKKFLKIHLKNLILINAYEYHKLYGSFSLILSYRAMDLYSVMAKSERVLETKKEGDYYTFRLADGKANDKEFKLPKESYNKLSNQFEKLSNSSVVQAILSQVHREFKSRIELLKKGIKAKPPKPKKLSQVKNFTVEFVGHTFLIRDGYLILRLYRDRKKGKAVRIKLPSVFQSKA